jgi:hypothetical protein
MQQQPAQYFEQNKNFPVTAATYQGQGQVQPQIQATMSQLPKPEFKQEEVIRASSLEKRKLSAGNNDSDSKSGTNI